MRQCRLTGTIPHRSGRRWEHERNLHRRRFQVLALAARYRDRVFMPDGDDFGHHISHTAQADPLPRRTEVKGWPACPDHRICGDGIACEVHYDVTFDDATYDVLKLTPRTEDYGWRLVPVESKTFTDFASGRYH